MQATFRDISGNLVNTTPVIYVRDPSGTVTSPSPIESPSVGIYYVDVVLNLAGTWNYRWEGSETVIAAGDNALSVTPSIFPD